MPWSSAFPVKLRESVNHFFPKMIKPSLGVRSVTSAMYIDKWTVRSLNDLNLGGNELFHSLDNKFFDNYRNST